MICLSDLPAAFLTVWPHILAMDALRYLIPASLAAMVVFAWAPAWLRRRRLQARRPRSADFRREIGYSLLTVLIFSLTGFGIYTGVQTGLFQVYSDLDTRGWAWLAVSIALALLAHDAYFYWAHRAMHHHWLYRRVHRLHHRSVTPTPWAAYAFHPTEAVIEAAFLPLFLLFVPMHGVAVTVFLAVMIFRNVVGHAGFELHPAGMACSPWFGWLATTTHHDMHHARPDGNFGLYFTWWDRLMGTEHPDYRNRFDAVTGRKSTAGALPSAIAVLAVRCKGWHFFPGCGRTALAAGTTATSTIRRTGRPTPPACACGHRTCWRSPAAGWCSAARRFGAGRRAWRSP